MENLIQSKKKKNKTKSAHTPKYLTAHTEVLGKRVFSLLLIVSLVSAPIGYFSFLFHEEFQYASNKKLL